MNTVNENILEVQHLKKYFPVKGGFIQHTLGYIQAVDDISFTIRAGRVLGLVGESRLRKIHGRKDDPGPDPGNRRKRAL